jgi:CelD/BcsL family acetyltransferase involved in cellulose biosynthesis
LSWKTPEPFPAFVPGLIRMLARKGQLRLGLAYVDGVAAAAQVWIVSNAKASIYKLAHDEKYSKLSVGTLLTNHLLRHALDVDEVSEVDYLSGDDPYKQSWMACRRERYGIVGYNPRTAKGFAGAINKFLRSRAKTLIRHRQVDAQGRAQSIKAL